MEDISDEEWEFEPEEIQTYRRPQEIELEELFEGFKSLTFFNDDAFLRMQAYNLALIDKFLTDLEVTNLQSLREADTTPAATHFLSAQTQMWIFSAYELMRTWRQRAKDFLNPKKLETLAKELAQQADYNHLARDVRAEQVAAVKKNPTIKDSLQRDLKRSEMVFIWMETVRMPLAKHEINKKPNSIAYMPGYARINPRTGSLDYEISIGRHILGSISRRDIAEQIRDLASELEPPTDEHLQSFKDFITGKGLEDLDDSFKF